MNNLKFIFYVFFVSFCFSNDNPFINVEPDYKVEVGIKSIVQADNDEYIASSYSPKNMPKDFMKLDNTKKNIKYDK